jgi:hypothetical protein
MDPAPLAHGGEIHECHALLDPVERQRTRRFIASAGQREDDAIAGQRLVTVVEHEEMPRLLEEPFFVHIAMVLAVEIDRVDQSTDDLLQGFERAVDLGFGDRSVLGIDDDRAHGGLRERVERQTGALSF